MTDKAREARNQYAREWRAKNRDRVREINRRYWEKKACEASREATEERKVQSCGG